MIISNIIGTLKRKGATTMSDLISRKWLMECIDEGWIKFDTEKDTNTYIHLVRDIAPSAQPERSVCVQEILDYLNAELHPIVSPRYWDVYSDLYDMVSSLLSAQPEIIRCKDCKNFRRWVNTDIEFCDRTETNVSSNDFCSRAERYEDDPSHPFAEDVMMDERSEDE